jgi:hypothetical protein
VARIIRPMSDENARLVNQAGLFVHLPTGVSLEDIAAKHFSDTSGGHFLLKITAPAADRAVCLKALNRMNINHATLFPDLYGSSIHCNNMIVITGY